MRKSRPQPNPGAGGCIGLVAMAWRDPAWRIDHRCRCHPRRSSRSDLRSMPGGHSHGAADGCDGPPPAVGPSRCKIARARQATGTRRTHRRIGWPQHRPGRHPGPQVPHGAGITAVIIAILVFVFQGIPTGLVVLLIAIIVLAVLGLIELIGRPPSGHQPDLDIPAASPDDRRPTTTSAVQTSDQRSLRSGPDGPARPRTGERPWS
jgi:hypothetical protein